MVAPSLIGCFLIKRLSKNSYLAGAIVETEAYSQEEASCHGFSGRTQRNKMRTKDFIRSHWPQQHFEIDKSKMLISARTSDKNEVVCAGKS